MDPSIAKPLYSTRNHTTPVYVRNVDCWAADMASHLTCISPWNSFGGEWRAGVAISPIHVLWAAHYDIPDDTDFRFVTADNVVVTRNMTERLLHPEYVPYFPDVAIGKLDSPLPDTIIPARILPDDWATKLPSVSGIPVMVLDREEKALVADIASIGSSVELAIPTDARRLAFYEEVIGGDSGNPVFMIVNNKPVLLTVLTYGDPWPAGKGTFLTPQRAAINAMMATLGGGHSLLDANLSGFI